MRSKIVAAALAATSMAAFPGMAAANRLDYSKNSVSGEYNVSPSPSPLPPPGHADAASVRPIVVRVAGSPGAGFDWGDALVGAGAPALLIVAFGGVRHLRRRRVSLPGRPGSTLASG
jgi:hypothetical protein